MYNILPMNACVFPGQGAQFPGMGKALYDTYPAARELFHQANEMLGFDITAIMFNGPDEALKQTNVTQPAIFLHSVILFKMMQEKLHPDCVAGHSLGEFSALTAIDVLSFEDGLKLVSARARAMQKACEEHPSTMAAIIGLDDGVVEEVLRGIEAVVVPANYNSPGQLVISGSNDGIEKAIELLREKGARRALKLPVGGAFHSPLMEPARIELEAAIQQTDFSEPRVPVYQNVTATAVSRADEIRNNLVAQLTSPVKWAQSIHNMIQDGVKSFTEVGPGNVLQGLIKKIDRNVQASSL